MLVFHGGSGHALNRIFYATGFHRHGWDVCLFEYPGFGARPGVPGKETFISAGLEFARERASDDPRPLFLFGESMGSGTVCAVAGTLGKQIAGVGLIVPYARLLEVAQWHLPYMPMALILRDQYDNIAALQGYDGPLTVVIAERDEVVSPEQGRKLHASYSGPKHLITLRDCTHAGFPTDPKADWWNELSRSLQR
jgi:pimeloyl-ACP methyl ester carboxylesterase